jgi:hypothetical protein
VPSAYYVPTHEASLTAAAARGLQDGLGCAKCGPGMGQFPGVAVFGRASKLAWYMPGVQSPSLLSGFGNRLPPALGGLGGLGAGSGGGRFNRSVSRGMYQLPFVETAGQGSKGLGQLPDPMSLVYLGIAALGLGLFFFGGKKHGRIRRRRRRLVALEA